MPVSRNLIKENAVTHSKMLVKKYIFAGFAIIISLLALFPLLQTVSQKGSYGFNAALETVSSLFAIVAGMALIIWYVRTGVRWQLFIGLAYFINGAIEFVHGFFLFVSLLNHPYIPAIDTMLIVNITEISGELFLIFLLFPALLLKKFFRQSQSPKFETLFFSALAIALVIKTISLFYYADYRQNINYENFISHPINLLYAFLLFFILLSYLLNYLKDAEMLNWWIFLSVSIIMVSQLYISVSKFQFDAFFEFGLLLKLIAYLVLLSGIFSHTAARIKQMKMAENQLISQTSNLQEIVAKQTVQLKEKNAELINEIHLKDRLYQSLIKSKEQLKKSEAHFRELFENSIIGMYQTSLTGDIITANKALCNLLGFKSFAELKAYDTNISRFIKPGERKAFKEAIEKEGFVSGFETVWLTKDKELVYVRESAQKKMLNNELIYEGTIENITTQKIIEDQKRQKTKELKNIIETVNVPVFGINKNKEIIVWNRFAEQITGYLKDYVDKKSINHSLIKQIFENKFIDLCQKALEGEQISDFEIEIKTKKGNTLKLLLNTTPQYDTTKEITGALFIARDITKLDRYKNKLEKEVAERTKELENALKAEKELSQLKSKFVSMASHEFRTPLATISFAAGFVLKYWHRLDEKTRELKLLKIEEQVKNMISLLDGVLTIGKGAARKTSVKPKLYKCKEFFDTLIDEVLSVTSNSHQIVYGKVQNDCDIFVDEKIGRKIFINLLTNAIKFSPDYDKVIIEYRCENNFTVVDIIDFGIGISDSEIDKVFIPFHRAENVDTIRGTGLGLTIVKESVEQLNGSIHIESQEGKGSRFTVSLPLPVKA